MSEHQKKKPRARDLGIPFEGVTGSLNALTDIKGVEVGFTTLTKDHTTLQVGKGPIRTGVTAILPRGKQSRLRPIWAGLHALNGNGELTGSHWIKDAGYFTSPICITNTHSVGMAHHAVTGWMVNHYKKDFIDDHAWAMPVIAETYDGFTNDICGQHLKEAHVLDAIKSAGAGAIAEGNIGGGNGMLAYEFKGGTGTSSRKINVAGQSFTVGALVQANFGKRHELLIAGVPVGREIPLKNTERPDAASGAGSIIVVIGTDIPMLPNQLARLAKRGPLGIARTGTSGGNYSGDLIIAFSTANDRLLPLMSEQNQAPFQSMECISDHYLDTVYEGAVHAVEEAIINAMIAAESVAGIKPSGQIWEAISHEHLQSILTRYNRLRIE